MAIAEADWRTFKEVRARALDRFSRRIVDECRLVCDDQSVSDHARYLKLYDLLRQRDKEVQRMFDDFRRSTAIFCLMDMWRQGLVDEDELRQFSPEVVDWVKQRG
ncbi:MAG: hypothetical protein C7B45_04465 [Sulfobacillus acidophilus]|uniref:Peptide ABC transporter substrate-binding protein n=1 Tax=Sulfobacillus acidophilus TaxID=53633 RepID=A0A2T2WLB5_9FIRM|nr:MAG: hypothetical protein C7B45_04465 [Sulfobacillus acidophilus]